MNTDAKSIERVVLNTLSMVFLYAGGIVFFFGDRFLHEFRHVSFAQAELEGIGGGLVLMCLGGVLKTRTKSKE